MKNCTKEEENDTLNFSPYIEKLVENLFQTYRLGNTDVSLNMDLEENIFLDMDTAVPLGIIVNELVSNSLKHAFTGEVKGKSKLNFAGRKPENIKTIEPEVKRKSLRTAVSF